MPLAFFLKPVRFDNFRELREPDSLKHSHLGPKIQEVALSITQMFDSQASRVTWKGFYTLANLLETFGQGEGSRKCNTACEVRTLVLEYSRTNQHQHSKSGTVITVIISSDILFTTARFNNGLMRMKGQGFQAGIPGRMLRGSICIASCQHKLCQTQLLCWELTQAAAQMKMKTIPGTSSTWSSPVHPGTFQKVPWLLICTAFNMVK